MLPHLCALCLAFAPSALDDDAPLAPYPGVHASAGATVSSVEVLGLAGSYFFSRAVTADARLTLVSADGGLSLHLPFSGVQHALIVSALGGFRHALLHNEAYLQHVHTGRVSGLVGYGFLGSFDVRAQAGVVAERNDPVLARWAPMFVFAVYAGKTF